MNSLRQSVRAARRVNHVARRNAGTLFEEQAAESKHAEGTLAFYRNISLLVAIPSCIAVAYKAFVLQEEPERPEFKEWDHLRKRAKKFPWGDGNKTLFHNPHMNALPDGYEAEAHH